MIEQKAIVDNIRKVFIEQDKYLFDKHVPEFVVDGKFLGDYYNQIAMEPKGDSPPRFYHNLSPFDVISNKAPDKAVVFENGEVILDIDFTDYVAVRTGAMTSLVMPKIGIQSLGDKKVLLIGAGQVAQQAILLLKLAYPDLLEISCISKSGNIDKISAVGLEVDVNIHLGTLDDIADYDVIICHSSASEVVLTKNYLEKLKPGVFIASFISSTEHGELDDAYYDTNNANIICDWEITKTGAKDLARAIETGAVNDTQLTYLKDLFSDKSELDASKKMTIYRSVGTPIQNMAVLQLLADEKAQ